MITKEKKQFYTQNIKDKDEKIVISNIIDKCNRSEALNKIVATEFLDLKQKSEIVPILNREKINYQIYVPNEYCEKAIIFFIPDYVSDIEYNDYISCIKINCKDMSKLKHKDFMGSIYNLGIQNKYIGDIFLTQTNAYVYILKEIESFIIDNLFKVSNQEVKLDVIELQSEESKNLKIDYNTRSFIIPSKRIDALICEVFNLSRKEAKNKIVAEELVINSRVCINPSETFFEGDIIALRRCGKFKVGNDIRKTRNDNICINIMIYK